MHVNLNPLNLSLSNSLIKMLEMVWEQEKAHLFNSTHLLFIY